MRTEVVTTLKRQATRILSDLRDTRVPVLITERGLPSAYLVEVNEFELMQNRMAILEGIARGEQAIHDNRVLTHEQAKRRMRKWRV